MHLSKVGYVSGSHSKYTVLSVAINVGSGLRRQVSEVTLATYSVLRIALTTSSTVQHPSCINTQEVCSLCI